MRDFVFQVVGGLDDRLGAGVSEVPGDVRRSLGDTSLPIAWIMPPGSDVYDYATHNREVREIQRRTQLVEKSIDLILPGAEHIPFSGQPADDSLLAARCAKWAMGTFYGAEEPASGPVFDRFEYNGEEGVIHFKTGTASGLTAQGGALDGFEAAAADGEFKPCKARIQGETVILTCDELQVMAFARYNWKRKPIQGLVNSAGLPAIPFNSLDSWTYLWWPHSAPIELPAEYHTTANKCQSGKRAGRRRLSEVPKPSRLHRALDGGLRAEPLCP